MMHHKSLVLYRFYKRKFSPWLILSTAGMQLLSSHGRDARALQRWHFALTKIDKIALLQSFYDFLDDLPWWLYG